MVVYSILGVLIPTELVVADLNGSIYSTFFLVVQPACFGEILLDGCRHNMINVLSFFFFLKRFRFSCMFTHLHRRCVLDCVGH